MASVFTWFVAQFFAPWIIPGHLIWGMFMFLVRQTSPVLLQWTRRPTLREWRILLVLISLSITQLLSIWTPRHWFLLIFYFCWSVTWWFASRQWSLSTDMAWIMTRRMGWIAIPLWPLASPPTDATSNIPISSIHIGYSSYRTQSGILWICTSAVIAKLQRCFTVK